MKTLQVDLGERSYPIHIGSGLLAQPDLLIPNLKSRQLLVVTNETVGPLYLDQLLDTMSGHPCHSLILPDGEQYKTLDTLNLVFDELLKRQYGRDSILVALGGGVIGDITGFAAACYQRGIDFVQVPTTLLAQVDSSVGGKTGVNHALGKNMIGAFHQPICVVADIDTLTTLNDRELHAGLAEIIKYGLIRDAEFFSWLESNMDALLARDASALSYAIQHSCQAKAKIVATDELEHGQRALLNLGHTFGHAIETGMGYGTWLHGEAVGAGMLMAADLSQRLGWLSTDDVDRIESLLTKANLPVRAPHEIDAGRFRELMAVDKKVINKKLRMVLLKQIGQAVIAETPDEDALNATLRHCREQ